MTIIQGRNKNVMDLVLSDQALGRFRRQSEQDLLIYMMWKLKVDPFYIY